MKIVRAGVCWMALTIFAGGVEVVTKLSSGDCRRTQMLLLTLSGFGIVRSVAELYQT